MLLVNSVRFSFWNEKYSIKSRSYIDKQADTVGSFNATSIYLNEFLKIDFISKVWSILIIIFNSNQIRLLLRIPLSPFRIYIFSFLTIFCRPKFMLREIRYSNITIPLKMVTNHF